MKKFDGIMSAPPHKRYKNLITTAADIETVWLWESDELYIWPEKIYAQGVCSQECLKNIDVHIFCEMLSQEYALAERICVFPNGCDVFIVSPQKLLEDIQEELERVE